MTSPLIKIEAERSFYANKSLKKGVFFFLKITNKFPDICFFLGGFKFSNVHVFIRWWRV